MKGLVLAGGAGSRLRPITHTSAKQLVPVANKPILFYGLESLRSAGITDVGIIVGHTAEEIKAAVGDGSAFGLNVTYIPQDAPRGLAHAVMIAEDFLKDEPFVMYLGDNLIKNGINSFVEEFESEKPDAMVLLAEVARPEQFGVAELHDENRIKRLVEKPKEPKSNLALVGVYLFSSCIFEAVKKIEPSWRNELEITDAIQYLVEQGKNVRPHRVKGWWKDTGRLEDLLEANRIILEGMDRSVKGEVIDSEIDGRVVIEKGAVVRNSTIRGPAVIGSNTVVENSYVGPFTAIYYDVTLRNVEIENSIVLERSSVTDLTIRIEESLIGQNVQVRKGNRRPRALRLMLGDSSSVEVE